jgi:DNA-binding TFAR19-related protein (PDSD5 family)
MKSNEKSNQKDELTEEQILSYLRVFAAQILEPEAYSRLMIIKSKNPKLFSEIMQNLIYFMQNGQLKRKISEKELIEIAKRLLGSETKPQTKIIFKRKGE